MSTASCRLLAGGLGSSPCGCPQGPQEGGVTHTWSWEGGEQNRKAFLEEIVLEPVLVVRMHLMDTGTNIEVD